MLESLRDRLEMMIPPLPGQVPELVMRGKELVVLLHGLWRSPRAMAPLQRALAAAGFSTLNIPYPSFSKDLTDISEVVRKCVNECAGEFEKFHFVTHSLGGIVARFVIDGDLDCRISSLVMLAPPSQGSDVVEWAGESLPLRLFLGPAGTSLTVNNSVENFPFAQTGPEGVRGCAIMGDKPAIPGLQWLLGDSNDGIVTVEGGRLPWLEEFHVVPGDHTYLMMREDVQELTLAFLGSD